MPKIRPTPWDYAPGLARMGLAVVPLRPKTKIPMFTGWAYAASRNPLQIREWTRDYPLANVGVVLREHLVVDVDEADEFAEWLDSEGYLLPRTMEVVTGRGRHHYYRLPGLAEGLRTARVPGADLKVSGLVVAPGSLHPSGATYRLTSPRAMDQAPDWLIEQVTPPSAEHRPGAGDPEAWGSDRQQRVASVVWGAPVGRRNELTFWAFCRAHESGLVGAELDAFLERIRQAATAKGLPHDEVATTEASAAETVTRAVA